MMLSCRPLKKSCRRPACSIAQHGINEQHNCGLTTNTGQCLLGLLLASCQALTSPNMSSNIACCSSQLAKPSTAAGNNGLSIASSLPLGRDELQLLLIHCPWEMMNCSCCRSLAYLLLYSPHSAGPG